jgi:hypothetical protein
VDSLEACPECGATLDDESEPDPERDTVDWSEQIDERPQGPEGTHLGRADQSLETISPDDEPGSSELGDADTGPMSAGDSSLGEQPPTKEVSPLDDIEFDRSEQEEKDAGLDEDSSTTLPKPDTSPGGLEAIGEETDTQSGEPSLGERLKRAREKSQVRNISEDSETEARPGNLEPDEPTGFPTLGEDTERALDEAVDSATGSSTTKSGQPDKAEADKASKPARTGEETSDEDDQESPSAPPPMPGRTSPADGQRQSSPDTESRRSGAEQEEGQDAPQMGAEELVLEDDDEPTEDSEGEPTHRAPEQARQPERDPEPSTGGSDGTDEAPDRRTSSRKPAAGNQQTASASTGWLGTLAVAVGVMVVAGIGYVYFSNQSESTGQTSDRAQAGSSAAPGGQSAETKQNLDDAIGAAQQALQTALEIDPSSTEAQLTTARRLTENEEWQSAATLWTYLWEHGDRESIFDTEVTSSYLDVLSEAGRFVQLRAVALDASQRFSDSSTFVDRFRGSIDADPGLDSLEPVTLGSIEGITSIADPENSDMPGLALRDESGHVSRIFMPERDWNSAGRHWRDAVALWRLCRIVPCGFQVPQTRAARVSRSTLEELASPHIRSLDEAAGASFVWSKGSDGEVLKGAVVDWPGGLKRWPIEAFEVWRPWLDADNSPSNLDRPVSEAFAPFADIADGYDAAAVAGAGDASLREVSRQLSQLLLTDFLLNNWGRFASQTDEFGSRSHMADGRFVTVRTDTVFQLRNSTRVKGRFRWTSRFSRDAVDAIEMLERGDLVDHLFPATRPVDRNKIEILWNQRDRALERVDSLVERHGRDPVFVFE